MTQRGPVLAYPTIASERAAATPLRAAIDALLASHDLELVADRPGGAMPALRVVDCRTGQPPARIPDTVAGQLAAWVAGQGSSAVA